MPVSKLPELVYETKKDLAASQLRSTIVGHVGDGNFHALIIFNSDEELKAVSAAVHRLVHRAVALDGTCTGEHGVGVGKKEYLIDELGADTVELMRTVKHAIDPLNIMNPTKVRATAHSKVVSWSLMLEPSCIRIRRTNHNLTSHDGPLR